MSWVTANTYAAMAVWLITVLQPAPALAAPATPTVLEDFNHPFLFVYGSWQGRVRTTNGYAAIRDVTNQGGAGQNQELDLRDHAQASPALLLRVGPSNRTSGLRLLLRDAAGRKATWDFPLPPAADAPLFFPLLARDAAPFSRPHTLEDGADFDLGTIRQVQLMGDWSGGKALDVDVDAVLAVPADAAVEAQREAHARAVQAEEVAQREARAQARQRIRRGTDSPRVEAVAAAAPDYLALVIQAGRVVRDPILPYEAQPGDTFAPSALSALAWQGGRLTNAPVDRLLLRATGTGRSSVGWVIGGANDKPWFRSAERLEGTALELATVDAPDSYLITSADDPRCVPPIAPVAVWRKTKPTDRALPDAGLALRHTVYLRLPFPLTEGCTYTIELPGLNTMEERVRYHHDSRKVRCESLHATQIGHRPDDPFKRAFLSLWLGTGGGYAFQGLDRFELLDAGNQVVFTGAIEQALGIEDTEQLRVRKNYSQTAVYRLDYSTFRKEGVFRVHIPGLGCSDPFPIADDAWGRPFGISMKGFLHQRSGIELGPPFTTYRRPRNFHPADGVKVFASRVSLPEAEQGPGEWFGRLVAGRTERVLTNAWGGYADAGDFDRRSPHLWATYLHLELFDCFPDYFGGVRLALPPLEATNSIPDLLDEALWNIEFFRRLQEPDGGVRGGVECSEHPRAGEPSWLNSLCVLAYAPDPVSSHLYAACAARAARLLRPLAPARANALAESAVRAWDWGLRNGPAFVEKVGGTQADEQRHARATAAVELLWLTGEARFHRAFMEDTVLRRRDAAPVIEQQGAVFAYARLPRDLVDSVLQQQAREALVTTADAALAFANGNAFGLTTEIQLLPEIGPVGYFTVPGMISRSLPRAHFLTGDVKYLEGTVRSCNFSAGANPDNLTFTTRVGVHYPRAPLHIDSRVSGQSPPEGITVYGASDPARNDEGSAWVHTWVIGRDTTPPSRAWPATEAYVDLYLWPLMNEFTMHQTLGPTSYTWGYLAARKALR